MDARDDARDFFISYRSADQPWAEWIAWELEAAGYTVFVQAWDFRPGQNFVHQMQQGASCCHRTIAVLTPAYFEYGFTRAEWYSAFARDPTGEAGLLLPVRVADCDIAGLLGQIIYIDLVGLEKTRARERLLAGIEGTRAKPEQPPPFPDIFPDTRDIRVIPALPPPSAEDRRWLLILLDRVKQFWVDDVLEQSVQNEALINLGKETQPGAVEHPLGAGPRTAERRQSTIGAEHEDRRCLRERPAFAAHSRRTRIGQDDDIAGAGTGSSCPCEERHGPAGARGLQPQLLERKMQVTLRVADGRDQHEVLHPKRLGRRWLAENRLLLLLDGLDEVQSDRRAACIRAINAFLEEGTAGLVVCSRLAEYVAEPVRLKMKGAVCLRPLTATQIETYLSCLGSQLDALRAALNKDELLRDLAKSPLMLSVMTLAYQGASAGDLAGEAIETPEVRRAQIYDTYIDRMFARKGKATGSAQARDKRLLSWLAHNMERHGQTIFLVEEMQPSWLDNIGQIFLYLFGSRLGLFVAAFAASMVMDPIIPANTVAPSLHVSSVSDAITLLTMFLGLLCSSSIDVLRFRAESHLARHGVLFARLIIILAHSVGWAVIACIIGRLFFHDYEVMYWFALVAGNLGFIVGLVYCRRNVAQEIRFHERLSWSWYWVTRAGIAGVAIAFISIATTLFIMRLANKDAAQYFISFSSFLLASIVFWPMLLFWLGLRTAVVETDELRNYGIRSALANAAHVAIGGFACGVIGVGFLFVIGFYLSFMWTSACSNL